MSAMKVASALLLIAALQGTVKAEEPCAGCPVEFNPKAEGVEGMINKALTQVNSGRSIHVLGVIRATKQLVNGVKYTYELDASYDDSNCIIRCRMVLISQPWIAKTPQLLYQNCTDGDKNDNFVARPSRQLLGGLKEVDKSEMGLVQELADFAVSTLDDIDTDGHKQVVLDVIDAKKQLVNGIMYHLELEVRSTGCQEGANVSPHDECMKQTTGPIKHCKMQIHRSWADKSPYNAKVVKSECEPVEEPVQLSMGMPGGLFPMDQTNGDRMKTLTDLSLERINMMMNSVYVYGLEGVDRARQQVVAGMMYYLTMTVGPTQCMKNRHVNGQVCQVQPTNGPSTVCDVKILEVPWKKILRVENAECKDKENHVPSAQNLRSLREVETVQLEGGVSKMDPSDPVLHEMSGFALDKLSAQTNSEYRLGTVRILGGTKQVVEGMEYTVTMEVGETKCKKHEPTNSACDQVVGPTKICTMTIWDRPWLHDRQMLQSSCDGDNRVVRETKMEEVVPIPGAPMRQDPNSPFVKQMAGYALSDLDKQTNSEYRLGYRRILSASTQVVAGDKITLTMEIGETSCRKDQPTNGECEPTNGPTKVCTIMLWDRPWLNDRRILNTDCHDSEVKMEEVVPIPGAPMRQDPNSPFVKQMAGYALSDLDKQTNSEYRLGYRRILSASTQVVAGDKITLTMEIGETSCKKDQPTNGECEPTNGPTKVCTIVLWDRPWLNDRRILNTDCHDSANNLEEVPMPGAPIHQDVHSDYVKGMASFALTEMDRETNSAYRLGAQRIMSATTQVVDGVIITLTMQVSETTCRKNEPVNGDCKPNHWPVKVCKVKIMDMPWRQPSKQLMNSKCTNLPTPRSLAMTHGGIGPIAGGISPIDVNSPEVKDALPEVVKTANARVNSVYQQVVTRVLQASTQVVEGTLTRMTVEIADSGCKKSDDTSGCDIPSNGHTNSKICQIGIWSRPWLKKTEVTEFDCNPARTMV